MTSETTKKYSVVGVLCATEDGPGVCTPIFRNEDGDKFFIQSFRKRRIKSFEYVGEDLRGHIVSIMNNVSYGVGDAMQIGLLLPDGRVKVVNRKELSDFFAQNSHIFISGPFMFYQLARMTENRSALADAYGTPEIREAIAKRRLVPYCPKMKSSRAEWSGYEEFFLRMLWEFSYSANEIAQLMGVTRNTVLRKAGGLGIMGQMRDLFEDLPSRSNDKD